VVSHLESSRRCRCPVIRIDAGKPIEDVWADARSAIDEAVMTDVLAACSNALVGKEEGAGCDDVERAKLRLSEAGERATITYERTYDDGVGRVRERREWEFDGDEGGWICVGAERAPMQDGAAKATSG